MEKSKKNRKRNLSTIFKISIYKRPGTRNTHTQIDFIVHLIIFATTLSFTAKWFMLKSFVN